MSLKEMAQFGSVDMHSLLQEADSALTLPDSLPALSSSLFTPFISLSISLQPVRWVSISRWRAMACAVNVLSTATQRPELPSPAPATPTTIERRMTRQQLHAPVSTNAGERLEAPQRHVHKHTGRRAKLMCASEI